MSQDCFIEPVSSCPHRTGQPESAIGCHCMRGQLRDGPGSSEIYIQKSLGLYAYLTVFPASSLFLPLIAADESREGKRTAKVT